MDDAEKNPKVVEQWIRDINELNRGKTSNFFYSKYVHKCRICPCETYSKHMQLILKMFFYMFCHMYISVFNNFSL